MSPLAPHLASESRLKGLKSMKATMDKTLELFNLFSVTAEIADSDIKHTESTNCLMTIESVL